MMDPVITKRGNRYLLRYDEYVTEVHRDGSTKKVRRQLTRSFATKKEAKNRRDAIIAAHARGEAFIEAQDRAVALLRDVGLLYAKAARTVPTGRYRMSMYNKFAKYIGDGALVSDLSSDVLRGFAEFVKNDGRKRIDRFVGEVERMWKWADDREIPGVPKPRKIVGLDVFAPPPMIASATPSWDECDAMIRQLKGWQAQVATVLRYTGVRASQVLSLKREDLDLNRQILYLRADVRGAKRAGHRAIPMHPSLVAELQAWNLPRSGPIFISQDIRRKNGPGLRDEKGLGQAFTRAWVAAGVPAEKWGAPKDNPSGREKARPAHSLRGTFLVELIRQRTPEHIADRLIGHKTAATRAAYAPEGEPETSPYWGAMVEAIATVPGDSPRGKLRRLSGTQHRHALDSSRGECHSFPVSLISANVSGPVFPGPFAADLRRFRALGSAFCGRESRLSRHSPQA